MTGMTELAAVASPHRPAGRVLTIGLLMVALSAQAAAKAESAAPGSAIALGRYLAKMGDCLSCHSSRLGGDYGGGLRINTPFGYLMAPNITFDPTTGIGSWTKEDFWNALHFGRNKAGGYLYPAMPYTFFTKITRTDSDAIYAYLATVPQQIYPVGVNHLDFPFSIRATMLAWNELFFTPGSYVAAPNQSAQWNRGAYIVDGLGHCGACHDPRNSMGAVERSARLTGGKIGDWFAANLTPDKQTGLGTWSDTAVVAFLKRGQNARMVAEGPMAEVIHNSLRYLTGDDLLAIAVYLKAQASRRTRIAVAPPVSFARMAAATLFINDCAGCHGAHGSGIASLGPRLAANALVVAPDPTNVVRATVGGLPAHFGRLAMASQLNGVTARQLADIINYVRTSWGNDAPANVTPAMIFAMQGKTAPH
jgi:mono/diheme cytochrome c family protein